MNVDIFLLILKPNFEEDNGSYYFVSESESPSIPSIRVEEDFGSIENILESILTYYIGLPSFNPSYILLDVSLQEENISIYYYVFIPSQINLIQGNIINISEISDVKFYQKILTKII